MTDTPAPAEYAPHMVMASRYSPLLYAIRDIDPDICVLVHHKQATPILTVSLEEAARRASNVWHARDAIKMWQAIVLEICALKVREARDVAAPRALPDRETLARTIFGIMTFGGTWFSSDGILEMRSLCAADRALELCAGAAQADIDSLRAQLASEQKALKDAKSDVARWKNLFERQEQLAKSFRARAEKAEAERDAARAELAELRKPSDLTDSDLARLSTGPLVGWKELRAVANAAAAKARAQAQPAAAVPAKPTLEELESAELKAQNRYLMFISRGRGDDRNVAMLVYLRSEWGRAAAAVDAHKKENQ